MIIFRDVNIRYNSKIANLKYEISKLELEIDYHQDKIIMYKESIWEYKSKLEKILESKNNVEEDSK